MHLPKMYPVNLISKSYPEKRSHLTLASKRDPPKTYPVNLIPKSNPEKRIRQNLAPKQTLSKRTPRNLTRTLSRKTYPPKP